MRWEKWERPNIWTTSSSGLAWAKNLESQPRGQFLRGHGEGKSGRTRRFEKPTSSHKEKSKYFPEMRNDKKFCGSLVEWICRC